MHPPKNPHKSYNPFHPELYHQERISQASPENYPEMATNGPLPIYGEPGIERFLEASCAPRPGTCWGPQTFANYDSDAVCNEDENEGDWSPAHKKVFQNLLNTQHNLACAPPKAVAGTDGYQDIFAKFQQSQLTSEESYRKLVSSSPRADRKSQSTHPSDQKYHGQVQSCYRRGADDQDALSNPFDDGHQLIESKEASQRKGPRSTSSQASSATANRSNRYKFPTGNQSAGYHYPVMPSGTRLVTDEEMSDAITRPWERASNQQDMAQKVQSKDQSHHSNGNGVDRLMELPSRPQSLERYKSKSGDTRVDRWGPVERQSSGSDDKVRPRLRHQDSGYGSPEPEHIATFLHDAQSDIRDFGMPNKWSKHNSGSDCNDIRASTMLNQCPSLADIKRSRNGSASTQGVVAPGGAWDPAAYCHNSQRNSNSAADKKHQALRQWAGEDYPPPEFHSYPSSKSDSSDADSEGTKATFSFDPLSGEQLTHRAHESTILSDLNGLVAQCETTHKLICNMRTLQASDRMMEVIKRKQIDTGVPAALLVLHKKILVTIDVLNHIERPFEGLEARRVKAAFEMVSNGIEHVETSH